MDNPAADTKVEIVVSDQLTLGTYANFASIVHNFAEITEGPKGGSAARRM